MDHIWYWVRGNPQLCYCIGLVGEHKTLYADFKWLSICGICDTDATDGQSLEISIPLNL